MAVISPLVMPATRRATVEALGPGVFTGLVPNGHFDFSDNVDGWSVTVGTGTLTHVADDSASHDPGGYSGCMAMSWVSPNDCRAQRDFTGLKSETTYHITIPLSFGLGAARAGFSALDGTNLFLSLTPVSGSSTPQNTPQTTVLAATTPAGIAGQTIKFRIQRFAPGTSHTVFIDSVTLEEQE